VADPLVYLADRDVTEAKESIHTHYNDDIMIVRRLGGGESSRSPDAVRKAAPRRVLIGISGSFKLAPAPLERRHLASLRSRLRDLLANGYAAR
jgi:hypothetical protein